MGCAILWVVPYCGLSLTVVPYCGLCHIVGCAILWVVIDGCAILWVVPYCGLCHIVGCAILWVVPYCGLSIDGCAILWVVPYCGLSIDGCAILWVVNWPTKASVQDYVDNVCDYVLRRLKTADIAIVFDRYHDFSIKFSTRLDSSS